MSTPTMTPEQLTEQTIAAFAAWKKDPKTLIQDSFTGTEWRDVNHTIDWSSPYYRIEPFTLGNSINGHTLGEGEQWHRVDGWKPEWLTGDRRPLICGEEYIKDIDEIFTGEEGWEKFNHSGFIQRKGCRDSFYTTTRPLPSAQVAPGHNPDKLTVAQVVTKDGWRLVDASEGLERRHSADWWKATEFRTLKGEWTPSINGEGGKWHNCEGIRTRLTREELAALDAPKPQFRPFTFEEVPLTPKVKRKKDGKTFAPHHSSNEHKFFTGCKNYTYAEMLEHFTFLDGTPFGVEVTK